MYCAEEYSNKGNISAQYYFSGEIICDTVFWNPAPNATDWYTPMIKKDGFVMIRLMQASITGLKMKMIDKTNTLPSTWNKNIVTK